MTLPHWPLSQTWPGHSKLSPQLPSSTHCPPSLHTRPLSTKQSVIPWIKWCYTTVRIRSTSPIIQTIKVFTNLWRVALDVFFTSQTGFECWRAKLEHAALRVRLTRVEWFGFWIPLRPNAITVLASSWVRTIVVIYTRLAAVFSKRNVTALKRNLFQDHISHFWWYICKFNFTKVHVVLCYQSKIGLHLGNRR